MSEHGNGAASGNATTSTTSADVFAGAAGGVTHSTTQVVEGSSLHITGTSFSCLEWVLASHTTHDQVIYVYVDAAPGSNTSYVGCRNAADTTYAWEFQVGATQFRMKQNTALITNGTYTFTSGQWYRIDITFPTTSTIRVRGYTGATLHSTNTADAVWDSGAQTYSAGAMGKLLLGTINATTGSPSIYFDYVDADDAALPAPYSPPPPPGGGAVTAYVDALTKTAVCTDLTVDRVETLASRPAPMVNPLQGGFLFDAPNFTPPPTGGTGIQRWDGTQWVDVQVEKWNGSFWSPVDLEKWSGNEWAVQV